MSENFATVQVVAGLIDLNEASITNADEKPAGLWQRGSVPIALTRLVPAPKILGVNIAYEDGSTNTTPAQSVRNRRNRRCPRPSSGADRFPGLCIKSRSKPGLLEQVAHF